MSFEGHYQCACKNGHDWSEGLDYDLWGSGAIVSICPECGEFSDWFYLVDDTNCDGEEIEIHSPKGQTISSEVRLDAVEKVQKTISYYSKFPESDSFKILSSEYGPKIEKFWAEFS